jgi:hypothetical protein
VFALGVCGNQEGGFPSVQAVGGAGRVLRATCVNESSKVKLGREGSA